ncbi:hypothetical protein [Algivirga pacifica]|uniref:Type IX secretion system membrane protein PorP/SprF n=1 Tax=Algivirga pacifica TaxID=1162670 RepID=A0ABP9D9L1_9BACT
MALRIILCGVFILPLLCPLNAQVSYALFGPEALGVSNAHAASTFTICSDLPLSVLNGNKWVFQTMYTMPMNLVGLGYYGVFGEYTDKAGQWGVGSVIQQFGDPLYYEQGGRFFLAHRLGSAKAGGSFNFWKIGGEQQLTHTVWSLDIQTSLKVEESLHVSVLLRNLSARKAPLWIAQSPGIVLGAAYEALEKQLEALFSIQKFLNYPASIHVGLHYQMHQSVVLRAGYQSYPASFSLGGTFKLGMFEVSYAHAYRGILPSMHSLGLTLKKLSINRQ